MDKEKQTKWEETGINLWEKGAFSRMDYELMEPDEILERKQYVLQYIEEFEDELTLIEEFLEN